MGAGLGSAMCFWIGWFEDIGLYTGRNFVDPEKYFKNISLKQNVIDSHSMLLEDRLSSDGCLGKVCPGLQTCSPRLQICQSTEMQGS